MNNYINVRIQSTHNSKIKNRIKHNIRYVKSLNDIGDEPNLLIDLQSDRTISLTPEKSKNIYKAFSTGYNADRKKHNISYKQREKRNLRETFSTWGEGIITFSEQLKIDLGTKYSQTDLINEAKKTILDICTHLGAKPKMMVFHLSESTPHFHFFYENFDDAGRSITFKNRTRDKLSKLQDIAYDNFKNLGMERGVKKDIEDLGIYDYTTTKQWKLKQLQQEQQNIELAKSVSNEINLEIATIQKDITDLTTQRDNLKLDKKTITADIDLSKDDKKQLHLEINQKQADIRDLIQKHRQTVKDLKTDQKTFKNQAIIDINNILSNSKSYLKYDTSLLKQNIYKIIKKYSNYNINLEEYNNLQSIHTNTLNKNNILYNENINLSTINNNQLNNINELKSAGKELVKRIKAKDTELSNQSTDIYNLQADLNTLNEDVNQFSNEHNLNFEQWQHNKEDLDCDMNMDN